MCLVFFSGCEEALFLKLYVISLKAQSFFGTSNLFRDRTVPSLLNFVMRTSSHFRIQSSFSLFHWHWALSFTRLLLTKSFVSLKSHIWKQFQFIKREKLYTFKFKNKKYNWYFLVSYHIIVIYRIKSIFYIIYIMLIK